MDTREILSPDFNPREEVKKPTRGIDKLLLLIVGITVVYGFIIFSSAANGVYARQGGSTVGSLLTSQSLGILLGTVALIITTLIPYYYWRKFSIYLFGIATLLMILVVIPGLGFLHGGSTRWLEIGPLSFQPADIFKITAVMLYASYVVKYRKKIQKPLYAFVPLGVILAISFVLLHLQPKYGTFAVIGVTLYTMFMISGAKARHIFLVPALLIPIAAVLIFSVPYVKDRLDTFTGKIDDPRGSGYQIEQSLIAVGAGGLTGRGYGISLQRFSFLPEPTTDSIFSVAAEEFGFLGSSLIVVLVTLFTYRCLVIASKVEDLFARLLVVGLAILISSQSFLNIAAMLGLFPISGMPLVFISHGGTAMMTALGSMGIVLNISKYSKL